MLPSGVAAREAKDAPAAVPRLQAQAFALGYALRTTDTRALAFTQSVQQLRAVDNDSLAGAEVAHLSRKAAALRLSQTAAYKQIAALLAGMAAPESLRAWANTAVAGLSAPLVLDGDAKDLAKTEPETARVLAALRELNALKAAANSRQQSLTAWLALSGGRIAVWSAETGAYTADLHRAATVRRQALPAGAARALLAHAPADAPAPARQALADLIPTGGGNLQALATLPPAEFTPQKLMRVDKALTTLYGAGRLATALDEAAGATDF